MATQAKTKYGIPVSGRVDVLLHQKLKNEANKYGLTMSKMVDTALSQWAETGELREIDQQLRNKIKQLETQLAAVSQNADSLKSENAKSVSDYNKMEKHYTNQLNRWKESVILFIESIAGKE